MSELQIKILINKRIFFLSKREFCREKVFYFVTYIFLLFREEVTGDVRLGGDRLEVSEGQAVTLNCHVDAKVRGQKVTLM